MGLKNLNLRFNMSFEQDIILYVKLSHLLHVSVKCLLGNVGKLRYNLGMKSCGAKRRKKEAAVRGGEYWYRTR